MLVSVRGGIRDQWGEMGGLFEGAGRLGGMSMSYYLHDETSDCQYVATSYPFQDNTRACATPSRLE